ncbi:MAG: hypothetical protein ACLU6Y_01445 [Ruminococcus sp.]
MSDAEKKKHSDLWQYIVKKYGRSVNDSTVKKIADALSVEADAKAVHLAQKKAILAAMKRTGTSKTGTQRTSWRISWRGSLKITPRKYVLRKSDGAIMQNMLTGDKVINPQGAENLYNFATNPDQFLESRSSLEVGAAGVEKLNRLISAAESEHQAKLSGKLIEVITAEILSKMDSMMSTHGVHDGEHDKHHEELKSIHG